MSNGATWRNNTRAGRHRPADSAMSRPHDDRGDSHNNSLHALAQVIGAKASFDIQNDTNREQAA